MKTAAVFFAALAAAFAVEAETPLVTVNVIVQTNSVNAADDAADDAARVAAAERAARADAAKARSSVVVGELIADMKPVPGQVYLLGRTEVTAEQWHSVMKQDVPFVGNANLPASGVSWDDCQDFLKRLNEREEVVAEGLTFRLPTRKEWQHACRAGAKGKWGFVAGNAVGRIDSVGWYAGNSGGRKSIVAQKTPNAWGFYDMHGGVFEWCSDTSPEFGGDFRLRVGGSFRSPADQCAATFANSANRQFSRYDDQGFRILCERR